MDTKNNSIVLNINLTSTSKNIDCGTEYNILDNICMIMIPETWHYFPDDVK